MKTYIVFLASMVAFNASCAYWEDMFNEEEDEVLAEDCESQSVEESTCDLLEGVRFDSEAMCYRPLEPYGCIHEDALFGGAISFALDPQGRCWSFGYVTELPEGWRDLNDEDHPCIRNRVPCPTDGD